MREFFSDKTEEGIRFVWMQFDRGKKVKGQCLLQEAAQDGDPEAYCFLGCSFLGIKDLEVNNEKAFEYIRKSTEKGSACGILTMFQFQNLAEEVLKNIPKADRLAAADQVLKKAEQGHAFCQAIIGMYYFTGGYWLSNEIDVIQEFGNEEKAKDTRMSESCIWFEKALYNGFTAILTKLSDIYEEYEEYDEKYIKAMKFAAECGDPYWIIQYAAWLYEEECYEEALIQYQILANLGYYHAFYDIGYQYENGIGVKEDPAKAVESYQQGAKQGDSTCQTRLGKLLLWGKVIDQDEAQAFYWFEKAAEQNDQIANMWRGHCMLYGIGTKKNENDATTHLIEALDFNFPGSGESQQMSEESQFDWQEDMLQLFWDLGDAYENGLGMPKRQHNAGYYFSMVADGGWPKAIEKMTHYKRSGLFKRWKRIK